MRSEQEIRATLDQFIENFEKLSRIVREGTMTEPNHLYQMAIAGRMAALLEWVLEDEEESHE